jgi:hypothetical protein
MPEIVVTEGDVEVTITERPRGLNNPVRMVSRAARIVYQSRKGGKPLNIGINRAKRVARSADERDQLIVLRTLGPGLPREHSHHQQLVRSRHRYYHEQHSEGKHHG